MSRKEILSPVADVIAFAVQVMELSGFLKIIVGLVLFLFAAVWGFLERNNPNLRIRALAIVSSFVGAGGFLYIALVTSVVHFQVSPPAIGTITHQDSQTFPIDRYSPPNHLTGTHTLTFAHQADVVEVDFAPAPKDRNRVTQLRVTRITPLSILPSKVVKPDPIEDGVLIEQPLASASADMDISATLAGAAASPVEIFVEHTYAHKDFWWRVKRWIFARYA